LLVGDDVVVDGKCAFIFAARYCDDPTLSIGNRSRIGHNCAFTIAKRITIGDNCRFASDVWLFDSSGHPLDPDERRAGLPCGPDQVRPVTVQDNVWIGRRAIVFPGVTIGENSVVSAGSVVMSDVPPNTIVAGNPARKIGTVSPSESARVTRELATA
jgi:acetyltransferase-like isoleucine patch superfamily enzyme